MLKWLQVDETPALRESLWKAVFYRGALLFGIASASLFVLIAAIKGYRDLGGIALRAYLGFPLAGALFGLFLWSWVRSYRWIISRFRR
jgi:hypothetical protein